MIPDYQAAMLPILEYLRDGGEQPMADLVLHVADVFELSPDERQRMLPSGASTYIGSRVGWARTYLKKAGLLKSPKRGFVQITDRGRTVLDSKPAAIDNSFLDQFPEFLEFRGARREELSSETGLGDTAAGQVSPTEGTLGPQGRATPEEVFENAYQGLRAAVEADLLDRVKTMSPVFFERLVVTLLVNMGYGGSIRDAGQAIGRSGDGGIDGIIKEDRLGLDTIYVQAKRWEGSVGRPEIQKFAGALQGFRARKGVFITTSSFTREASEYVRNIETRIVLIDGQSLAGLMAEHSVGVSSLRNYPLLKVDPDFFVEE